MPADPRKDVSMTPRRGRPITGSPKKGRDGLYTVRVPIPGTNKTRAVKLGPEIETKERASEVARHWHEKLMEQPALLGGNAAPMTVQRYLDAWTEERAARIYTARMTQRDLERHVLDDPALANLAAERVGADDLRRVVARLNAKVESGQIEASTARKVWAKTRCMFREMFDHEKDALRIRKDDPTASVRPPRKGVDKVKAVLYPDEAAKLLDCGEVPLHARRL